MDFGDGAKSVAAEPWHKYGAAGNYTITVNRKSMIKETKP